ncbi:MAG: hypothetical protein HZA66_00350 [Rhodopseudomonas palustris]|uniref:DUF1311 domain-containing protein n=1 Tax=Rhodopseudomonas palustris TaxID=1076 RepID=A0A933VTQ7_RHOPL|nr:hypothetical protein [Rhodopseudomonas palustris]
MRLVTIAVMGALLAPQAMASDRPTLGLLTHTSEWSNLRYKCAVESDGQLLCAMAWSDVRKLSSGKTLKDEIAKGLDLLKTTKPGKPEECDDLERRVGDIRHPSRASPGIAAEVRALDPRDRRDLVRSWELAAEFCRHPTRQTMIKLVTQRFEQRAMTCSVDGYEAYRRFKKVDESTWASTTGPDGVCGWVSIARFERDAAVPEIWNYVEQRSIAHPHIATPDLKCSEFKPSEQRYVWGVNDFHAGCEFISFVPF